MRTNVLTLVDESTDGAKPHRFSQAVVAIGRVQGNDLVLAVRHISSRHAKIQRRGDAYLVVDLGSTNGSMVLRGSERHLLGPRGAAELELKSGDLLVLGDIDDPIRLRVSIERDTDGPGTTAIGATENRHAPHAMRSAILAARPRAEAAQISGRLADDRAVLRALLDLVEKLNSAHDQAQALDQIAAAALAAIDGATDALIVTLTADGPVVQARAHCGSGARSQADQKICERVWRSGEALLFGPDNPSAPAATLATRSVGAGIAAPLHDGSEISGVLQVNCRDGEQTLHEGQLDVALVLAHHAASALCKAALIERLARAEAALREENAFLRKRTQPTVTLIAESPKMRQIVDEIDRAAASDVTVLLCGETGTGKEVAARYLHAQSARAERLMVPVNCGALSETLLDSELFGHKRGAFTGATADRKGVFEVAEGGSVFLDEVGETPLPLQVRLLRVLEAARIKRVGESIERKVDARIIAATNRDLKQMVEQGSFRRDLYYRLCVFPLTLPALRERPDDIEPLCQAFIQRFSSQLRKPLGGVAPSMLRALRGYSFPGNVRELANEIERAMVRAAPGEMLSAELLSADVLESMPVRRAHDAGAGASGPAPLRELVAQFEREVISEALGRHGGRRSPVAQELGLTRQGLAKKIDRLGL